MIFKTLCVGVLLALVGCASTGTASSGCTSPSSYECQVDMYMRAGG
jgi:hypothetical protein